MERLFEAAITRAAVFESKAETLRRGARIGNSHRCRRWHLRKIDEAPVVAEILRTQFRMAIDTEPADHQTLEVTQQKIGEKEGAGLFFGERGEGRAAGEHFVAMGSRD